MSRTGGTVKARARGLSLLGCVGLLLMTAACAQPEPDEQLVAAAVGKLPGVIGVDASFTGRSLGGGGDQKIEVEVASPPDADQVDDLVRSLPKTLQGITNADGYDEFVIVHERDEDGSATPLTSSFAFGVDPVAARLAQRWAKAVGQSPPGGLSVRVGSVGRPTSASLSAHAPLPASLEWAVTSGLADLSWTVIHYQTTSSPFVRFSPDQPLIASMVEDWEAIEATYAGGTGAASIARAVVVEDAEGVRQVQLKVTFPTESGPVAEATHGKFVWPIVTAIDDAAPDGDRLDLELSRAEKTEQGTEDGDLVDAGTGSADWEAAYRKRFPDAVPVSAPPT